MKLTGVLFARSGLVCGVGISMLALNACSDDKTYCEQALSCDGGATTPTASERDASEYQSSDASIGIVAPVNVGGFETGCVVPITDADRPSRESTDDSEQDNTTSVGADAAPIQGDASTDASVPEDAAISRLSDASSSPARADAAGDACTFDCCSDPDCGDSGTCHDGLCVACTSNDDCVDPAASICSEGVCVPCSLLGDTGCSHIAGRSACSAGTCVECTAENTSACEGLCDTRPTSDSRLTCTSEVPRAWGQSSLGRCESCVSDAHCRKEHRCLDVGPSPSAPFAPMYRCAYLRTPQEVAQCADGWVRTTSVDGVTGEYCLGAIEVCSFQ